jgi:hypothetical protein
MRLKTKDKLYKINSVKAALFMLLTGLIYFSFGAQSLYFYKGFLFKHPYFENKCLFTTQNTLLIDAPEDLLSANPKSITYSGNVNAAVGFYLSGDSLYAFSTSLIKASCYNTIECTGPKYIPLANLVLDSNTAIYAIKTGSQGTLKLCISGGAGGIYLCSINPETFSVVSKDSTFLKNISGRSILSVNGYSTHHDVVDSILWVTGSNGLLRCVKLGQNLSGNDSVFDIVTNENITCYSHGMAGTNKGSVFERKNATFEKTLSVSGEIHSMNEHALAGNGVVYAKNTLGWTKVIENSTGQYRECLVTANSSGAFYELISEQWNIDTVSGANSATKINSIIPKELYSLINTQNQYKYQGWLPETLFIQLSDYEKNYEPLSIVLSTPSNSTTELGLQTGDVVLNNADPSGLCKNGNVSLADSVIRIILSPNYVSVLTNAMTGLEDLRCMQCALKSYPFKNEFKWGDKDRVIVHSATQKLEIVNTNGSVSYILNQNRKMNKTMFISSGTHFSLANIPDDNGLIDVKAFDLTGKNIPAHLSGNTVIIDKYGSCLIALQFVFESGKIFLIHTILTKR